MARNAAVRSLIPLLTLALLALVFGVCSEGVDSVPQTLRVDSVPQSLRVDSVPQTVRVDNIIYSARVRVVRDASAAADRGLPAQGVGRIQAAVTVTNTGQESVAL